MLKSWKILFLLAFVPYIALSKEDPCVSLVCRNLTWTDKFKHCGTFIHECENYSEEAIINQYSLQGFAIQYDPENSQSSTYKADRNAFLNLDEPDIFHQKISPPPGMLANELVDLVRINAKLYKAQAYWPYGPNSNSAADFPLYRSGIDTEAIPGALGLHHYHKAGAINDILNDAVKLIYSYGQDKLQGLMDQIKSEIISSGSFKKLNIGDSKASVVSGLKQMKAYYVSTQSNYVSGAQFLASDGMINLHPDNNTDAENRLYGADTWNVTYDSEGETFWFLQLDFTDDKLSEVKVKSSSLELP